MKQNLVRLFPRIRPRRGTLTGEGDKGQRYCPNCHYPLPHYGEYCSNCGQRYTDGRVPLKFLVQDFIDNVLNIDSKLFRTTWALIKPGKLTNEFFNGHHKRYASPARLFFVATVVHFAVIGFLVNEKISSGLGNWMENNRRKAYELPLRDSLQKAKDEVSTLFSGRPVVEQAMDSLFARIETESDDSTNIDYFHFANWNIETKSIRLSYNDLFNKTPPELVKEHNITGSFDKLVFQQVVKVQTHTDSFGPYVVSQLVWMVILMMPALALILKLLYIRRNRYFVEHLVFSFHYHAFAFWVFSIMMLVMSWTGAWENSDTRGIVILTVFLGILVYLFIAMRRVYKQGFFKTFIKYNMLSFAYLMICIFFLSLTFVVSALMF